MEADLLNQPVVIDSGSGSIKAGVAGQDVPSSVFPSLIGRAKHSRAMLGGLDGDMFVGPHAANERGLLRLNYPMSHGIVEDWDDMERLWGHLWTDALKAAPEEHPVLMTEPALQSKTQRDTIAQIMLETFNVPAIHFGVQAVLALYASGRTTGMVLDCGDGVTHAVPVYKGFQLTPAIKRVDIAGRNVTELLQLLLRKNGTRLTSSAEFEIVRQIKEQYCYCAINPQQEEKDFLLAPPAPPITLPDGQTLALGSEVFRAPELLFKPHIIGSEEPGCHTIIMDAISRADRDLRSELYQNIVLSGGSTLTQGFGSRVLHELKQAAPRSTRIKIYAPQDRRYSIWIGGSILAGLSTFTQMWVTAEQYQENPDCIHAGK